jgi:serine/threonine protein kinase
MTGSDREFREEARAILGREPVNEDRAGTAGRRFFPTRRRLRRAADSPETAGTPYTILEELGRGGMGTVYRALDATLDREVALKVSTLGPADPDEAERMRREARVMARLEHPGIVPVHDAGQLPDGRRYYAMRLVRGERLDAWARGASLSDRLGAFRKICDAVAFAHAHGVVHRDLKPENVMIGSFGEVLVLDWSVARRREEPAEPPGTVVGTRSYMAPEQAGTTDSSTRGPTCMPSAPCCSSSWRRPGLRKRERSRAPSGPSPHGRRGASRRSAIPTPSLSQPMSCDSPRAPSRPLIEKTSSNGLADSPAATAPRSSVLTYLVVRASLILFLGR